MQPHPTHKSMWVYVPEILLYTIYFVFHATSILQPWPQIFNWSSDLLKLPKKSFFHPHKTQEMFSPMMTSGSRHLIIWRFDYMNKIYNHFTQYDKH